MVVSPVLAALVPSAAAAHSARTNVAASSAGVSGPSARRSPSTCAYEPDCASFAPSSTVPVVWLVAVAVETSVVPS